MINPLKLEKVTGSPAMIMIAIAQATIFHGATCQMDRGAKGITKSAIPAATPFFFVEAKVTGIVAAEDWVPIAVM